MNWVEAGRGDGSHGRRVKQLGAVDLLLLDDVGLTSLSDTQQADLYKIICERYERCSTIITSNRDFAEWPMVFTNPLMGSAAMDRLVHRAVKIVIEGKSYVSIASRNARRSLLPLQGREDKEIDAAGGPTRPSRGGGWCPDTPLRTIGRPPR